MKPTLKAVQALAAQLGATVEVECDRPGWNRWGRWNDYTITAEAPTGHVFNATGDTHSLVVQGHAQGDAAESKRQALEGVMRDLQAGVTKCTVEDCEYCEEEGQR